MPGDLRSREGGVEHGEDGLDAPSRNDARLTQLKQLGYSTDENRLGEGVVSLAVPLLNAEKLADNIQYGICPI